MIKANSRLKGTVEVSDIRRTWHFPLIGPGITAAAVPKSRPMAAPDW